MVMPRTKAEMKALANADIHTSTTAMKVGDAVGVGSANWYIAIVNNNTEKQCAKKLQKLGYECYVPTQTETRKWRTGVRKVVDRIVLPSLVFIRTTETERRHTIVNLSYVKRFMTDKAGLRDAFGKHPVAVIPNRQIELLRFMLGNAESAVTIESPPLKLGDKVRVFRGGLIGLEGYVDRIVDEQAKIYILVDCLGCACVEIDKVSLELIK